MHQNVVNQKSRIIKLAVVLLITMFSLVIFTLINNGRFRLIKSVPSINGTVPTASNGFRLYFNKNIVKSEDLKKAAEEIPFIKRLEFGPNFITLFTESPPLNESTKFTINGIASDEGSIIKSITFDFKGKYVPTSSLTTEHTELIKYIEEKGTEALGVEGLLPYSTLSFDISFDYVEKHEEGDTTGEKYIKVRIFLNEYDKKTGASKSIAAYKKQALDYLSSSGVDVSKLPIIYEVLD